MRTARGRRETVASCRIGVAMLDLDRYVKMGGLSWGRSACGDGTRREAELRRPEKSAITRRSRCQKGTAYKTLF